MEEIGNYYLKDIIGQSGVSQTQGIPPLSQQNNAETFMSDTPFKGVRQTGPLVGGFYEGTSKYDESIGSVERMLAEDMTTDEARAEIQSGLNRLGNALLNNVVIAGTTAVSGTLGFAYGVLDALANGEINKLYDNPVNRQMLKWQEDVAKAAPNYYTKGYEESSIWNKLGTSIFWADLIKNLGYAEGMMIPGTGVSKLLQGIPKAAQIIGSSLYSSISEASIEALGAKQDKVNLESQIAYNSYLKDIQNGVNSELANEKYASALSDIKEDANNAGNFVLGYNMALLTATNALEWGKLFSRGNTFSRRKMLEQTRKQGINVIDEGQLPKLATDKKLWYTTKNIAGRFGKASVEGIEEVMQGVGTNAADLNPNYNDFNEHVYNQDYRELASSTMQSIGMALSDAMKDPDTYTNFAMGFFTGALGVPTLQNPKTNDGFRSPVVMEGGLKEFIENQREYSKKVNLVNEINSRIEQSDSIKEYYKGLVRNTLLEDKANVALELNDVFNFNNAQHAQLISDVIMFDNVGHIDVLRDIVNKATNFTDEDIQELISGGVFEDNGNAATLQEAREKITNNTNKLTSVLTNYLNDKALIESQKGEDFSKEALENILYAKSQIREWVSREKSIIDEVYNQYIELSEEALNKADFTNAVRLSEDFRNQLIDLNKSELTADVAEDLNRKIEDVSRLNSSINKFTSKIKEYWDTPNKANEEITKIKDKAVKKVHQKKVKSVKDNLSKAASVAELKSIINSNPDENIEEALNDLAKENNEIVKEYNNIKTETSNIESKIIESKEDTQAIQDALTLLQNASNKVNSVNQLKDLQLELYNDSSLLGEDNSEIALEKLTKARVVLQQALNASSEESLDTDSVVMDMEIPDTIESMKIDMQDSPLDSSEVGNSSVSKAKSVNNTDTKEVEQQEIKDSNIIPADNSSEEDIKDESEEDVEYLTEKDEDDWNPAISEFHRASLKKGQFVSTAKADSRFKDVWKYLYDNNAFEFVNKGNLKVGDTLYFGLVLNNESQWIKDSVFVYVKTDVGYQVLNTLYLTREEADFKKAILEEYNKSEKQEGQTQFISSYTSKVSYLKTGVTHQGNNLIPLETALEGTEITPKNMVLSVIRGVKKETGNFRDSNNEIGLPGNIGRKNGWTYIEIPNIKRGASDGRTAVPVFVTDYGKQNNNFENTQINKRIQNAIRSIATATNYEELKDAFSKLQKDLTTKKLSLFLTPEGNIRINERLFDSEGRPVINSDGKEAQRPNTIFKTNRDGSPKSVETIIEEIDNLLKSMNLRFRTNAQYINTSNYNQELLDSGILSSYLVKAEERNAWFTIEPVSLEVPQQKEVVEVVEQPKEEPLKQTSIESSDLDLNDLMSGFGGEINKGVVPDSSYKLLNVVGENISSSGSEFAKKLTNPKNNITVNYKGVLFDNAEHAYQTWKSGKFDQKGYDAHGKKVKGTTNFKVNYQIMVEIITAKLQQHPELIEGITNRGGINYLNSSTHNVYGDKYWETAGQNKFIEALTDAYNNAYNNAIENTNKMLLNNGYSQEDINKMSPEELQQAKKCLGF